MFSFFPPCSYLIGGKFHVHNTNMSKCNLAALLSTIADDVTVSCSYHSMNFENEASRLHPRHPCWCMNGYMIKNKITKEKVCKEQSKSCQWQVLIFSRQSWTTLCNIYICTYLQRACNRQWSQSKVIRLRATNEIISIPAVYNVANYFKGIKIIL